ncbi:MAG: SsrA-binding protein SmpB [Pseudomonadota bacterium]
MSVKIICKNKKALFKFAISERIEAGIVLHGPEIKSIRDGNANLSDAYAIMKGGEAYLINLHISPYQAASYMNQEPKRERKLLMHKKEIEKLAGKLDTKGLTLVPVSLYFKNGRVKVELGLGKGKKLYDKRATIEKRDSDRKLRRMVKHKQR